MSDRLSDEQMRFLREHGHLWVHGSDLLPALLDELEQRRAALQTAEQRAEQAEAEVARLRAREPRTAITVDGRRLALSDECRHGVPLDWNCNACSDEAAGGGRPNPRSAPE